MPEYFNSTAQTRAAVQSSKTTKSYGTPVGPRGVVQAKILLNRKDTFRCIKDLKWVNNHLKFLTEWTEKPVAD